MAASVPLLLDLAHPLDAVRAPGGVDLTLYPADGSAPFRVRLHGGLVQLLVSSVRTAHASGAVVPAADGSAELSPRERLDEAFAWVRASSSATSARSSGASNSAAMAASVSGDPLRTF